MQRVNWIVRNEINLSAAAPQHMAVSLRLTVATLKIIRSGSATAHGGKSLAYLRASTKYSGGCLKHLRRSLTKENESSPESRRLSSMCCGIAAFTLCQHNNASPNSIIEFA